MASRRAPTPIWVWPVLLILITALSALIGMVYFGPDAVKGERQAEHDPAESRNRLLETGRAYYVWVKMIEMEDQMPDGDRWDPGSDSAPDIQFELFLRSARLQESEVRENTFIARWDPIGVNVKDLLLNGTTRIDPAGLIQVPLVRVEADTSLELKVRDHDFSWMPDEQAGTVTLEPSRLFEGENLLRPSADGKSAIKQLTVVFFPEDLPMADLLQLISDR